MGDNFELQVNFVVPRVEVRGGTFEGVQIGNNLEGEVVLIPFKDVNCRGVWLEMGYKDIGNGTPGESRLVQEMIYEGRLKADEPFSYFINYRIPESAPPSYSGKYVNIKWFARIRLDIPFWFDKRLEYGFRVLPVIIRDRDGIDLEEFFKKQRGW